MATLLFAMFSLPGQAAETEDAQQRIRDLERQMQQMADQLKQLQEQMARNAAQPAAETAPATKPTSGGSPVEASFKNGLVFRDATGDWSFRPYLRAQLDYRHFSPDPSAADTFSMRRARIGMIATFYNDFTLRIEGEYSGDGKYTQDGKDVGSYTRMNDAYLDYTHYKQAMIRVGQFKGMHGLERSQGAMDLNFMERALSESILGSVFDRGVMLHGAPLDGVYYNLAYVNGTGQNIDETDALSDSKDWSLRLVGNAAQWAGWKDAVVHVGGFYLDGDQNKGLAIPKVRTEGRGVEMFKVADTTVDVDRTLYGLETALAWGPVKYQGEYIRAQYDGNGYDHDMSAWYASLQWLVTGEHYADRYAGGAFLGIQPKHNFQHGKPGWGALELGMRYSHFDASDFTALLANSATNTYTDGADAWTLGAKWVFNPNAQLQLNYVYSDFDNAILINGSRDDHEQAMNMRVQFDF